ncbi:MAG: M48 family metalloprotease [Gammaproteobacteria bacterium]|nr:M48 family metalloprotease [Gammaproteobacteria bacterium]
MNRAIASFLLYLLATSVFAFNPYSNSELDDLEKKFVAEINQSNQVVRDPLTISYLNQLGKRLTDSIHTSPSTFFIVESNEINAFAGPGGYIGIHVPLILATHSEDELAAVMAHELSHVKLHHLYDMIEHEKMMRIPTAASMLAAMALGVINPMLGSGMMAATLSGAAQHSINYTRAHEKEADRIGMQMLAKAGFNPHAMAQFFNKMHQETRYSATDNIPALLRSHPLDEERIAEAEDRADHLPHVHSAPSLQYELFKTYIRYKVTTQPRELMTYYTNQADKSSLINRYGLALAYISANQFQQADNILLQLNKEAPNQPFLILTLTQAELALNDNSTAITTLKQLYTSQTAHYATLLALADAYAQARQTAAAVTLLTKGFRQYPRDITICHMLAKAEAQNHRPGYAYFIEAECDHLLGQDKLALQRLKLARQLSKSDAYLKARIEAKIEELK